MTEVGGVYPFAHGRPFNLRQAIYPCAAGFDFAGNRGYFILIGFGPRRDLLKEIFVFARHTGIIPQASISAINGMETISWARRNGAIGQRRLHPQVRVYSSDN